MEKRTPHCKLSLVHSLVRADRVRATDAASIAAAKVGIYDIKGMCDVILSLSTRDFYKSMTTHADHKIWQDVYHGRTAAGIAVYLKLTVINDVLIVSFKER